MHNQLNVFRKNGPSNLTKKRMLLCWLLLSALACTVATTTAQRRVNPSWQGSVSPCVRLGVRDKFGELGSYTAVFAVTAPDGRVYNATKNVKGNDFGYVLFPEDFGASWSRPGAYSYSCKVNGSVSYQGKFIVDPEI